MSGPAAFRIEPITAAAAIAPVLAELHAESFAGAPQTPWSARALVSLLEMPGAVGLVALTAPQEAAGFLIGRSVAGEGEVLTVCVSPAMRRQGIASALIGGLRDHIAPARRLLLEVATTNSAARNLYTSVGFRVVGRRPAYYRHQSKVVDALILECAVGQ